MIVKAVIIQWWFYVDFLIILTINIDFDKFPDSILKVIFLSFQLCLLQICACKKLNRGSYMSAHVLLILLNELGKRDKMRGLPSILSLFRNEFNKFNKTRARMLDSIYHVTLRIM